MTSLLGGASQSLGETRERSAILNQLLFGGVALLSTALVVLFDQYADLSMLVLPTTLLAVTTAATILVPWDRLVPAVGLIVPAIDIVVVALLNVAGPEADQGLLWVFPVMWIVWTSGALASSIAVATTIVLYWTTTLAVDSSQAHSATVLVLPVSITALAVITGIVSRRIAAQRGLLVKQSRQLEQTAERAGRHEDTMREVLDAVDFGVIRIARDGSLVVSNEAQSRLHRERGRTAYGADGTTVLAADELPLVRARRGETFEGELVWYGQGPSRRALNVTARQISGAENPQVGTIVVSRDVTAEELALRAREDLVASVSHELRTPLTSILGYLDLALDHESLPGAVRRGLTIAQRNAERLLDLVADLLTASAASHEGAAIELETTRFDLAGMVRAAVESATPRAAERGITIDASGVESVVVPADSHRLRQVVDNLLSNAIKYNRDRGRVDIGCTREGSSAWIVVRDTGDGVSEAELPHLFERFFRTDAVRKTSIHGSGLGLAISRDIITAHGGEISVRSAPAEGTTFLVRLPVNDPRGER